MKEIRPIQKHLLALPPCPTCGGYRYLVARTRSKTKVELQALCISSVIPDYGQKNPKPHGTKRTYKTVTSIAYSTLDPHDKGIRGPSYAASLDPVLLETFHELQAIVAKLDVQVELATK